MEERVHNDSDSEEEREGEGQDFFKAMENEELAEGTKKQYEYKLKNFRSFVKENYPEVLSQDEEFIFPISLDILKNWFSTNAKKPDGSLKTTSSINGYRNGIKRFLSQNQQDTKELDDAIKKFLKGYKRTVAKKKEAGEMKSTEGKADFDYKVYRFLLMKSLQEKDPSLVIFLHAFMTAAWNLMARSVTVASLKWQHVGWVDDSLEIASGRHKGNYIF